MEEQTSLVETDRDELVRENEYLKAVLSNRTEIQDTQAEEANRTLSERVKELEEKNTELVDEINSLYEDRQTLISSLLHLRSEEVDDVIKRSRSNSLASRGGDSTSGAERLLSLGVSLDEQVDAVFNLEDDALHEQCKKVIKIILLYLYKFTSIHCLCELPLFHIGILSSVKYDRKSRLYPFCR